MSSTHYLVLCGSVYLCRRLAGLLNVFTAKTRDRIGREFNLMNANQESWSLSRIICENWGQPNCTAEVWASNWSNDELEFELAIHPDDFLVFYNVKIEDYSMEISAFQANDIIQSQLLEKAETTLDEWWGEVLAARKHLSRQFWEVPRGLAVEEIQYARLAHLYVLRAKFSPLRVIQVLSDDMSVPTSTTRERIRKAREKGFLTSPGKGLNGQGEITKEAIKLIQRKAKNE